MAQTLRMTRRQFVITSAQVGGGMALSIAAGDAVAAALAHREPWSRPLGRGAVEINPWISISPDDSVLIRVASPESGNGVMTQCAMTVTEELRCDWAKVRVESISLNRDYQENLVYSTPGDFVATFAGRSTIPERMEYLLQLGASARERLKAAAAERWEVNPAEIDASNGVLTHKASGRSLRYGEIADHAATIKLHYEPAPKPASEWTFLGKASPTKLTNASIVDGSGVFGIDVRVPGMKYAALMQSPVHGGRLKSYDFDVIKNMPGVRGVAVVEPSAPRKQVRWRLSDQDNAPQAAIAVVADHYWQARSALEALPVQWDPGDGARWKTTEQLYDAALEVLEKPGETVDKDQGDALQLLASSKRRVDATYMTPFCDQAPMEPLNGTALVTADRVDIWHPSAISIQAYCTAAEEAGIRPENVHLHQTLVGGSFGRRLFGDDVCMVIAVAKRFAGTPIQVIWSREEMTRQGRYRSLKAMKLSAALGGDGLPIALHTRLGAFIKSGQNGLMDGAYANGLIPNVRVESTRVPLHILHGAYRAPGYNSIAFFVESFIDECAVASGMDPLEYRLRIFDKWPDAGWKKCLEEVAAKSNWGERLPRGQGQGLAISNWAMRGKPHSGTTVAVVAKVNVTRAGELTVERLDLAFDCGRILNRDAVLAQLQGGMLFGLNMSLNEELTIHDGQIVEGNFDRYPMLRMAEIPKKLEVHFGALSGHDRFNEVGEPPVGPVGPAVANAIFRATGKRIRTMPFRKHDLRWT